MPTPRLFATSTTPTILLCRLCRLYYRPLPRISPRTSPFHTSAHSAAESIHTTTADTTAAVDETLTGAFQKSQKRALKDRHKDVIADPIAPSSPWEVTCGLEVHAQLNTKCKLFSTARMSVNAQQNTHISPIDASLPGTQPKLDPRALLPALRAAIALSCTPEPVSRFDRKHYFYWDQPAGYQITQFYHPLAKNGVLRLTPENSTVAVPLEIKIKQVQIEQDTGKTIQAPPLQLVDLNRVGAPLVEIITEPFPLEEAETAAKVLAKIQEVLRAVDACVLGMEWGGMRADVNVSVRRRGDAELGQRCEIKNLSSFKTVTDAVTAEAVRQIGIVEAGGTVEGETRGWDAEHSTTKKLRMKEGEVDYRYMPEPDLPPVVLGPGLVEKVRETLPPLPEQVIAELTSPAYGLSLKDSKTMLLWDEGRTTGYHRVITLYKYVVKLVTDTLSAQKKDTKGVGKVVGNWLVNELGGLLSTRQLAWEKNPVQPEQLADLITLVMAGKITGPTGKTLLPRLFDTDDSPSKIVRAENLGIKEMSDDELAGLINKILATGEGQNVIKQLAELEDIPKNQKKRKGLRGFVVGKVMREMGGKVKADRVDAVFDALLLKKPE
ncbi:GatB/GatE catalytic domain-containing protein [Sphaerosporella brunnea]|uniref:Glutamyl-tRNA(Gln) amidotransferase subunit B, mitochondrial n=1 Tax=Sphaerosporella brunnea TaxID=1250544 RepID=A0A5J5F2U4_9PEZI|nr:GatB/GatE catalytic domain-containing protein [Sphaerosporella brunnea]